MFDFTGLDLALFIFSIICLVITIATLISEKITDIVMADKAEEWKASVNHARKTHHVIPLDD